MAVLSCTYMLLNGSQHLVSSAVFDIGNRAFAHGDCITESIHTCADRLCFFDKHLQHLRRGMETAMMEIPQKFLNKNREFSTEISKLITKNRIFHGSLVTITVFRSRLAPKNIGPDSVEYYVHCEPFADLGYTLNERGLRFGIIDDIRLAPTPMSGFFTHDNSILKVIAQKQCNKAGIDDALTINTDGQIVESALNGNVFFIKGNTLITPPLATGCKDDVMRRNILEIVAPEIGLTPVSDMPLREKDLRNTDEFFTASTVHGIKWVAAFKSQRFMRAKTTTLLNKLNALYKAQQ